jgi:hypothetical protein
MLGNQKLLNLEKWRIIHDSSISIDPTLLDHTHQLYQTNIRSQKHGNISSFRVRLEYPSYSWDRLSREVQNESSLLYTRQRDIHAVGIVLLQMLMGLDVMERFPDAQTAIHACPFFFLSCSFCSFTDCFVLFSVDITSFG